MTNRLLFLSFSLGCCALSAYAGDADSTATPVIRSITLAGNDVTQPYVITREMSLHVGDTLSQRAMARDRDRIYNLGLFNKVAITHADSAGGTDLLVTVVERWYIFPTPILNLRSRNISAASYGLGLTHQNFMGRDERLSASFSTGYDHTASFTYQNPRLTDDDDIFLRASLQYRDMHSLESNSDVFFEQVNRAASVSLGTRFGFSHTLIGTAGYQTWQIPDSTTARTISPDGTDRFFELGLHYTFDARNVREYPTDGWYLDVNATNDGIGRESTVRNLTVAADARWYALIGDELTLAWRGFGTIVRGGPVPMYHYLYMNSRVGIRGYNQRDFSGDEMIGGSAEIRLPLLNPRFLTFNVLDIHQFNTMRFGIYAALFADIGKVWFRSNEFEEVPWLASAGFGIHFLLPYSFVLRTELSMNALGQPRVMLTGGAAF